MPLNNSIGVRFPHALLPRPGVDLYKWAVVACDQFTSEPHYWQQCADIVGHAPSTLDLILPEAYLGSADEALRVVRTHQCMEAYLMQGLLQPVGEGFIHVTRITDTGTRHGLIMALDLERYDGHRGANTLVRATEGVIDERVLPRLRIRRGALLELPHVLVLIDDPDHTVIEPLREQLPACPLLYDTELMLRGGHVQGHLVSGALAQNVVRALERLHASLGEDAMLFAVGDGNHSLSAAKASWQEIKASLTPEQQAAHPARYAMVEVENIHDPGIRFSPVHRVLFMQPEVALQAMEQALKEQGCVVRTEDTMPCAPGAHRLGYCYGSQRGAFVVSSPKQSVEVGTLQAALDAVLAQHSAARVDYIHGDDVALSLARGAAAVAFLLPAMQKGQLFPAVKQDGALPRKTFSMGEAHEKRYYMECRMILPSVDELKGES